jgi:acetoin utilization deacetylase AcuC-like enzyme
MPVVWSERHRLHEPDGEIWVGVRTPGTEVPARADRIRVALEAGGALVVDAAEHDETALLAVHDAALLRYLEGAWDAWEEAGLSRDPGQNRVVPYIFPGRDWLGELEPADPAAVAARAGRFAYDTMTLIGPGTWEAVRGAADAALTAADLVGSGKRAAYALCRPPGHHATKRAFGGSCYLNNAAIAASRMREALAAPVAVIDVDAHHGNGTQVIFYEDPEVLTASVHVDPGAGWFPHFLGFASESGAGAGAGANRNAPMPEGTGDGRWVDAIGELAEWARAGGARGLVVALGVDAAAGDPESPLAVTPAGYETAGRRLAELNLPTVFVQEGGYDLGAIGELVLATLSGFESGR